MKPCNAPEERLRKVIADEPTSLHVCNGDLEILERRMAGYLTTHVLDTARGRPAEGLQIELFRIEGTARTSVESLVTNSDGRTDNPILPTDSFKLGTYELVFNVGDYLDIKGPGREQERFFDVIPVRFKIAEDSHYHVPLLLSPFGYSTYRGS